MKEHFSRFLSARPGRLHAAAHSHHPWPDVTYRAHARAWEDAAALMDDKWDHVFGEVFPAARRAVASVLGLPDPDTLVFAPNTHEFVMRIASSLPRPFRVLTTDAEFHSFARQLRRWEEAGEAEATRVPAEPYESFPSRFRDALGDHDLVYFSHVHFDSSYVTPDLAAVVAGFPTSTIVVVDGYHGFMALPTDLGPIAERALYLAGGYKYAMAGEGACFLHVPPDAPHRPVDTGWFASFGALTADADELSYAPGGQRFAGATFDPSGVYRLRAV
ncbi:MAG: aminotransferase, partial [Actinomycetota bacterium]